MNCSDILAEVYGGQSCILPSTGLDLGVISFLALGLIVLGVLTWLYGRQA